MTRAAPPSGIAGALRAVAKDLAPPAAVRLWQRWRGPWRGHYATWAEAASRSTGYGSAAILDRTTRSIRQVLSGEKAFERDSVAFDEMRFPWPLLAILLKVAIQKGSAVRVVDFGGSLGSTYLRVKRFAADLPLQWDVVELAPLAQRGRELFGDGPPRFFASIEAALDEGPADVMLLSGVLPYLADPVGFCAKIATLGIPWILIDRTYWTAGDRPGWLTVQHVPPAVYRASYPAWMLNRDRLLALFRPEYEIFAEFQAPDQLNVAAESGGAALRQRRS